MDVMSCFMGYEEGGRELAGIAGTAVKASLDLTEKSGVEKNLLLRRTIERPHRRLRHSAAATVGGVTEQDDFRTCIGLPAGFEDFGPAIVNFAENARNHITHFVGRRARLGRP